MPMCISHNNNCYNMDDYSDKKYYIFKKVTDFCRKRKHDHYSDVWLRKEKTPGQVELSVEELFRQGYIYGIGNSKNLFQTKFFKMTFWEHLQYVLYLAQECVLFSSSSNIQKDTIEVLEAAKKIVESNLTEDDDGFINIKYMQKKAHYRFINPVEDNVYDTFDDENKIALLGAVMDDTDKFKKINDPSEKKSYWEDNLRAVTVIEIRYGTVHRYVSFDEFENLLLKGDIEYSKYKADDAMSILQKITYESLFLHDYIYDKDAPLKACKGFALQIIRQLGKDDRGNGVYQDLINGNYYYLSNKNVFRVRMGIPEKSEEYVCGNKKVAMEIANAVTFKSRVVTFGFAYNYDAVISKLEYVLSSFKRLDEFWRADRYNSAVGRRMSNNIDSEDNLTSYRFGRWSDRVHGLRSMSSDSKDMWKGGNLMYEFLRAQRPPPEDGWENSARELKGEWLPFSQTKLQRKDVEKKRSLRRNLQRKYDKLQKSLSNILKKLQPKKDGIKKVWYIVPYSKQMNCTQYLESIGYTEKELLELRTQNDPDLVAGKIKQGKEELEIEDLYIRLEEPHLIDPSLNIKCDENGDNLTINGKKAAKIKGTDLENLIPLLTGESSRNNRDVWWSDQIKFKDNLPEEIKKEAMRNPATDMRVPYQLFDGLLLNVQSELSQQEDIFMKFVGQLKGSKLLVRDITEKDEYKYKTCTTIREVVVESGFSDYKQLLKLLKKGDLNTDTNRDITFKCCNDKGEEATYNLRDIIHGTVHGICWSANIESDVDEDKWFIFEQHINLIYYWQQIYCLLQYLLRKGREHKNKNAGDVELVDGILNMLGEIGLVTEVSLVDNLNFGAESLRTTSLRNQFSIFLEKYQSIILPILKLINDKTQKERALNAIKMTLSKVAKELGLDLDDESILALLESRVRIIFRGLDDLPELREARQAVLVTSTVGGGRSGTRRGNR